MTEEEKNRTNVLICDYCGCGAYHVVVSRFCDDILDSIICIRCGKVRHVETGTLYPNRKKKA